MRIRFASAITILFVLVAAHPVEAAGFFEHVRYTRSGGSNLRFLVYSARYSKQPTRRCLYYNVSGVCMIEQFIDPSNYNPDRLHMYYPRYSRNYQSRERRYSNRDDDSNDDDDDSDDNN